MTMRAIQVVGDERRLVIAEVPAPTPGPADLLVDVEAAALNRADLLQRAGRYPPPPGVTDILGMDLAGTVVAVGDDVPDWTPGESVCALVAGGGYAERAVVPASTALRVPPGLDFAQAAAIPEVFLTAYQALFWLAHPPPGQGSPTSVLIHAGASGVGTAAIQLAGARGWQVLVTAGSPEKIAFCRELGADAGFDRHAGPFADGVLSATGGRGVDVILDFVGAPYWEQHMRCVARDGCLVVLALLGGGRLAGARLQALFAKRARVVASSLRSRDLAYRAALCAEFAREALPGFAAGALRPIVDRTFDWNEAEAAHAYLESNQSIGKVVLTGM